MRAEANTVREHLSVLLFGDFGVIYWFDWFKTVLFLWAGKCFSEIDGNLVIFVKRYDYLFCGNISIIGLFLLCKLVNISKLTRLHLGDAKLLKVNIAVAIGVGYRNHLCEKKFIEVLANFAE